MLLRNQQPSTIEIKRIEKVKDQKSMETRIEKQKYGNKKEVVTT